jgi:protein-L-isoaspartate(D-aspartate) O-methyltransferase
MMSNIDEPRHEEPSPDANYAQLREQMVERQLRRRGIADRRVLDAMLAVPRHEFVPADLRDAAYDDGPLPIGFGQTISQPFTVAFMAEALRLAGWETALEVGTGSGYAAAVLSRLVQKVHTIERFEPLALQARERLARLGYDNVEVHVGDGSLGLPEHAPFDAILVTAGAAHLPPPYAEQLAEGGKAVIPLGDAETSQNLFRFTRRGDRLFSENLGGFAFVPLVGRYGWSDA